MKKTNKALFLDRDGVINHEVNLLTSKKDVILMEGISSLIATARSMGFSILVATNQTVLSRGFINEEQLEEIHSQISELLSLENLNAIIDHFYISPFHPDAQVQKYKRDSECRKPRPGMLLKAQKDYSLSLEDSFFIGDRVSDVVAGNLAGCKTIFLNSGKSYQTKEKMIRSSLNISPEMCLPWLEISHLNEFEALLSSMRDDI